MKKVLFVLMAIFVTTFTSYAQIIISSTYINPQESKVVVPYDVTRNYLGNENVESYIGQILYVNELSENLKGYGYDNFKTSKTLQHYDYKCRYGNPAEKNEYNTKYEDLFGKYFKVLNVDKDNFGDEYYIFTLQNTNDENDIVYFYYDGRYEHNFPFVVVSHFEWRTTNTIERKYSIEDYNLIKNKRKLEIKMEWFNPINLTNITFSSDLGNYKNIAYKPYTLWGLSMSVFGVYYDIGWTGSQMGDSSQIGVWEDCDAKYWHIGYTIPISRWFTITPLYGKITNNKLIVDGNDWWVDSINGGLCNRTEIVETRIYHDYGAVLNLNVNIIDGWGLNIGAKITKYQRAVNFGVFLNIGKVVRVSKKNRGLS